MDVFRKVGQYDPQEHRAAESDDASYENESPFPQATKDYISGSFTPEPARIAAHQIAAHPARRGSALGSGLSIALLVDRARVELAPASEARRHEGVPKQLPACCAPLHYRPQV